MSPIICPFSQFCVFVWILTDIFVKQDSANKQEAKACGDVCECVRVHVCACVWVQDISCYIISLGHDLTFTPFTNPNNIQKVK